MVNQSLAFEELGLGQKWTSPHRVIVASDLTDFSELTGDHDPLHVDSDFASNGPFGRPIVHGLLGLSILAGLSSNSPKVQTAALVDIRGWSFSRPIYVGDSVYAVTEVIDLKDRGRRHGEVHWYRQLFNQNDEKVQDGILVTLVSRRVPLPTKKTRSFTPNSQTAVLPETREQTIEAAEAF